MSDDLLGPLTLRSQPEKSPKAIATVELMDIVTTNGMMKGAFRFSVETKSKRRHGNKIQ